MLLNETEHLTYDYIITGAGCAGLSLLLRLQQDDFFRDKKILILDADSKTKNDRTWCFWETTPGLFQEIVHKQWSQIDFYGQSFSARFDITPYVYKMIRGSDLYRYVFEKLSNWKNVVFKQEKVEHVYDENNRGFVKTATTLYSAQYVFNSILFQSERLQTKNSMLQHFKGWLVTTEEDKFNSEVATFMDFRLRPAAENTFVYVLPITNRKALIEYTVFSPSLLAADRYDSGLRNYISQYLKTETYTIEEEEFGVIPMSTYGFPQKISSVVNIGTAGGQTKSSSGYTFRFIQKQSSAIAEALTQGKHPGTGKPIFEKRFPVYDNTMLSVLSSQKLTASEIFSDLFKSNKPQLLFKFLDNETSLTEELKIMSSVPSHIFLPAALTSLF